jgi:hypothetical protein
MRRAVSVSGIELTYYDSVSSRPVPFSLAAEALGLSAQVNMIVITTQRGYRLLSKNNETLLQR